jgi:hypothetical protein
MTDHLQKQNADLRCTGSKLTESKRVSEWAMKAGEWKRQVNEQVMSKDECGE